MAKHKLTQLKQTKLTICEYNSMFGDMVEHAYGIEPTDSSSQILASNFIEGIQNHHVKNTLRTYQIKNLKVIFCHELQEDQKQKIEALDFGEKSNFDSISNCDINAISATITI